MPRQRAVLMMMAFFLLVALVPYSYAITEKVDLKGQFIPQARGQATLADAAGGQKEITIDAQGLKPDSVYTAWFANEQPKKDMAALGKGEFKSDAKGNAHFSATVPESEIKNWQNLEVALHPSGNPQDMKDIKIALKGSLQEEARPGESRERERGERERGY